MSNYNGVQVSLNGRNYHGLSFNAGYTYSHALADASDEGRASDLSVPLNNYASIRSQLYMPTNYDLRHRGTISLTYAVPGKSGYGQMLEGWTLNSVIVMQSGSPWGQSDLTTDWDGTGELNNAAGSVGGQWNFFGNPSDFTPVHGWTDTNPAAGRRLRRRTTVFGERLNRSNHGAMHRGGHESFHGQSATTGIGFSCKYRLLRGGQLCSGSSSPSEATVHRAAISGAMRDSRGGSIDRKAIKFNDRISTQFRRNSSIFSTIPSSAIRMGSQEARIQRQEILPSSRSAPQAPRLTCAPPIPKSDREDRARFSWV